MLVRLFSVVIRFPDGSQVTRKLDLQAYLGVVAATNFKQRCRKMLEYYHADRLNYAVSGTPNKLEYDQGFFVKLGDGAEMCLLQWVTQPQAVEVSKEPAPAGAKAEEAAPAAAGW